MELSGETTKLSVMPGKVTCAAFCSLALLIRLSWLSEDCVPLPLKTRVCARLGVTTIIPGVLPAGNRDLRSHEYHFVRRRCRCRPTAVPALTLFVMKARYLRPLVWRARRGRGAPQLSHVRLAGSRNNSRIRTFFKPRTPTSCRIITWMQEKDYSKGRNCGGLEGQGSRVSKFQGFKVAR